MKRNNFLDVLKGICILLVILIHIDWPYTERLQYLFPYWVNPAVPIFMITSGYVYTESFKRKDVTTLKQAYDLKGIIDKLIRYTLPFILIYIIEVPLRMLVYQQSLSFSRIFINFWAGGWGSGGYYFPCMLQFIFLFPLIYFAIRKWDFYGLLICAATNLFYEIIKVPLDMSNDVFRLIVFRYIFAIALGCYFSMGKFKIKKWMAAFSFIFGATFIYIACYTGYKPVIFYYWRRTCMLAVLYIAPIAYWLIKKCKWDCQPLALLGKASYNIFFVQKIYFHLTRHLFDGVKANFGDIIATYAICILLGLLFYKIETPITKKVLAINSNLFAKNQKE